MHYCVYNKSVDMKNIKSHTCIHNVIFQLKYRYMYYNTILSTHIEQVYKSSLQSYSIENGETNNNSIINHRKCCSQKQQAAVDEVNCRSGNILNLERFDNAYHCLTNHSIWCFRVFCQP